MDLFGIVQSNHRLCQLPRGMSVLEVKLVVAMYVKAKLGSRSQQLSEEVSELPLPYLGFVED